MDKRRKLFYDSEEFRGFLVCHTYRETAERFNLTEDAVRGAAANRGLKAIKGTRKGRKRIFDNEALRDYYKTHTAKETAAKFGCSEHLVQTIGRKNDFVRREAKKADSESDRVPSVLKENVLFCLRFYSFDEVAKKFGIKVKDVVKIYMEERRRNDTITETSS